MHARTILQRTRAHPLSLQSRFKSRKTVQSTQSTQSTQNNSTRSSTNPDSIQHQPQPTQTYSTSTNIHTSHDNSFISTNLINNSEEATNTTTHHVVQNSSGKVSRKSLNQANHRYLSTTQPNHPNNITPPGSSIHTDNITGTGSDVQFYDPQRTKKELENVSFLTRLGIFITSLFPVSISSLAIPQTERLIAPRHQFNSRLHQYSNQNAHHSTTPQHLGSSGSSSSTSLQSQQHLSTTNPTYLNDSSHFNPYNPYNSSQYPNHSPHFSLQPPPSSQFNQFPQPHQPTSTPFNPITTTPSTYGLVRPGTATTEEYNTLMMQLEEIKQILSQTSSLPSTSTPTTTLTTTVPLTASINKPIGGKTLTGSINPTTATPSATTTTTPLQNTIITPSNNQSPPIPPFSALSHYPHTPTTHPNTHPNPTQLHQHLTHSYHNPLLSHPHLYPSSHANLYQNTASNLSLRSHRLMNETGEIIEGGENRIGMIQSNDDHHHHSSHHHSYNWLSGFKNWVFSYQYLTIIVGSAVGLLSFTGISYVVFGKLLNDRLADTAVELTTNTISSEKTQISVLELTESIIKDEKVMNNLQWLLITLLKDEKIQKMLIDTSQSLLIENVLKSPQIQSELVLLLSLLLQDQSIHLQLRDTIAYLLAQPVIKEQLVDICITTLQDPELQKQSTESLIQVWTAFSSSPDTYNMLQHLLQEMLQDQSLIKESSNMIWKTVKSVFSWNSSTPTAGDTTEGHHKGDDNIHVPSGDGGDQEDEKGRSNRFASSSHPFPHSQPDSSHQQQQRQSSSTHHHSQPYPQNKVSQPLSRSSRTSPPSSNTQLSTNDPNSHDWGYLFGHYPDSDTEVPYIRSSQSPQRFSQHLSATPHHQQPAELFHQTDDGIVDEANRSTIENDATISSQKDGGNVHNQQDGDVEHPSFLKTAATTAKTTVIPTIAQSAKEIWDSVSSKLSWDSTGSMFSSNDAVQKGEKMDENLKTVQKIGHDERGALKQSEKHDKKIHHLLDTSKKVFSEAKDTVMTWWDHWNEDGSGVGGEKTKAISGSGHKNKWFHWDRPETSTHHNINNTAQDDQIDKDHFNKQNENIKRNNEEQQQEQQQKQEQQHKQELLAQMPQPPLASMDDTFQFTQENAQINNIDDEQQYNPMITTLTSYKQQLASVQQTAAETTPPPAATTITHPQPSSHLSSLYAPSSPQQCQTTPLAQSLPSPKPATITITSASSQQPLLEPQHVE